MSAGIPEFARNTRARSRSISAENPRGAPGEGATAVSRLGLGRKGRPCISLPAGESQTIADIRGPGVIRHIWITVPREQGGEPFVLRNLVIRMTWDDAEHPAVEVPLGDFFGCGFGEVDMHSSALMTVAPNGGLNCFVPMPFRRRAVIEIVNDHGCSVGGFFYQVDYSLGDVLDADAMYLHAQWRRTNGDNPLGEDHVVALAEGSPGSYIGTYIFLSQLERYWYGEGEVKFFIDSDERHPTIAGTGLEDYVGGAWAFQDRMGGEESPSALQYDSLYLGYHQQVFSDRSGVSPYAREMPPSHGMYRWHVPDPIRFSQRLRVTLQQIGDRGGHLFERRDDVSTVGFWYQQAPSGRGDYRLPGKDTRTPR